MKKMIALLSTLMVISLLLIPAVGTSATATTAKLDVYACPSDAVAYFTVTPNKTIFNIGETVTIKAQARAPYVLQKWIINATVVVFEISFTFQIQGDTVAAAIFTEATTVSNMPQALPVDTQPSNLRVFAYYTSTRSFTLTTGANEAGTITAGGTYQDGAKVTVTAYPYPMNRLLFFEIDGVLSYGNPLTVIMDQDHQVTAYFGPDIFQ